MKKLNKEDLILKLKHVEALFLDADGTMTDGSMYIDENGLAIRSFYAHDGVGIAMVKNLGVQVVMLTTSLSPVMAKRSEVLNLDNCITGSNTKGVDIKKYCDEHSLDIKNVIHMGDDVNDVSAFMEVGIPISVANSAEVVHEYTSYITKAPGGKGAVREVCDLILLAKTGKLYGPPYITNYTQ